MRLLDVACGSGALSIPAARLGARVTGADLSPDMIQRLTAQALAEGPNLEGRVMDGQALEFVSGRQMWDWVVNSNPIGAMLVADTTPEQGDRVRQALDEMLRERSGGDGPAVLTNPINIGIGTA